ncbi:MAG: hypothetical protein ACE5GA_11120, partial [Candidatus Zixiibacteriota bacterium]
MKLKTTIALLVGLTLLAASLLARPRMDRPPALYKSATPVTDATIDANRVFSYVTNLGTFARDNVGVLNLAGGGGMVYPFAGLANIANGQANKTCVFASGIWIGGIDSTVGSPNIGDTLMTISEFSEENVPGPMLGGTFQTDNPSFRVYKLYRDSLASNPNADYLAWPVADGAPVDSLGAPELTGDQMLWSVFNDADPAAHGNDAGSTLPMGIEIQMSTFAFTREGALGDIIFLRYKIMNKGNKNLRQVYISLWSDPDLGGFADDLVGSDTALSLGFVYNATSADAVYGSRPPAVGYDFFQGPLVASPGSTGRMWGIPQPGFTNLGLVSFNKYINGTDPDFAAESYMYQNGLDAKAAAPLIDPTTGLVTKFFGSGDPVTGTGFLDSNPADRRFMLNTGPIDFNPGDSTEVIAAIIVGQGNDRKSSITLMKFFDETAQSTFDNFFQPPVPPAAPVVSVANLPNEITLTWGNESELSPGDFDFQGYTVYQGPTVTGPWTRLLTADVIDTIAVVLERELDLASGELVELPKQLGSNSGLQRFAAFTDDA